MYVSIDAFFFLTTYIQHLCKEFTKFLDLGLVNVSLLLWKPMEDWNKGKGNPKGVSVVYGKHFTNKYLIQAIDCNNKFFLSDTQHHTHTHTHTLTWMHTSGFIGEIGNLFSFKLIYSNKYFCFTVNITKLKVNQDLTGILLVKHKGK